MAGRDKDREFCTALLLHGHVSVEAALAKLPLMPLEEASFQIVSAKDLTARIRRWAKECQR